MDRAYTNLLAHLQNAKPTLPLTTIQSALAHYLAHLSPLPTPLAGLAISSPLYLAQPFTADRLQSLLTAFRHATHSRYRKQIDAMKNRSRIGTLFSKSLNAALDQWIEEVVKGVQGGHSVLRLSSLSGLLLGISDLEAEVGKTQSDDASARALRLEHSRNSVEDELVVAVAEVMDTHSYGLALVAVNDWEHEFVPAGREVLLLSLIIAAQSLPLVSQSRFDILPLPTLNHLVMLTLSSALYGGKFLHNLPASASQQGEYRVFIPLGSPSALVLKSITASPVFTSTASLSRLAARCLRSRLESYSDLKKSEGLRAASETLRLLRDMAVELELDWTGSPLASAVETPNSRPISQTVWSILKTVLFSTIMISDAILSSIIYIQPGSTPYIQTSTSSSELALRVLEILSCFAFIISQFGGVTSSSQGFEQLKKTFYLALDILAHANSVTQEVGNLANSYVRDQCLALKASAITEAPESFRNAKKAFLLASIEQLVPALSGDEIRDSVFDVCWPHLSDPSHRETFESAHSVILSVFASHAQRQQRCSEAQTSHPIHGKPHDENSQTDNIGFIPRNLESSDFVRKMVPFYAHCLLENSADGRLSTPQLRLAFAALVRCAGASGLNVDTASDETLVLSWYCMQLFIDAIHSKTHVEENNMNEERLHRLRLAVISAVPSLPLALMLQALQEIKTMITSIPISSSISTSLPTSAPKSAASNQLDQVEDIRDQLIQALFQEIMVQAGYREKSAAMQWWYENRSDLQTVDSTKVALNTNPSTLFSDYGIGETDTVMLFSPNQIDYPLTAWAIHRLGSIVTCSNPQFTTDELCHQLRIANVTLMIVHSTVLGVSLSAAKQFGLSSDRIVLLDKPGNAYAIDSSCAPSLYKTVPDLIMKGLNRPFAFKEFTLGSGEGKTKVALLSWSSGTTGLPKMAVQCGVGRKYRPPNFTFCPGEVALGVLPFYHVAGFTITVHLIIFCSMTLLVPPKYDFFDMLNNLERHRVSHLLLVPPQAAPLSKYSRLHDHDLSNLKTLFMGAAPVSPQVQAKLCELLPGVRIGQIYGMTEMTTVISMMAADQQRGPLGSSGRLLPGIEARIVKLDGTLAAPGEPGELVVRGPAAALGYWQNPAASSETFVDGWVRTGDQVILTAENEVLVQDRLKVEFLKVKGFQVAPAELEGTLLGHTDVVDCCVVGVLDERRGEVPLAYVVLSPAARDRAQRSTQASLEIEESIKKVQTLHRPGT
ncbi:hypothetical protein NP233_g1749 [Leucocoprinus birnbaumii]|uniref:Acetyl-CoA synthetase-like protein n=1 Tax=Leucocoprinus birnbaumii TaxID=56174 RepID=A0AAD5YZG4_9AGAR|nr:hypothetical protein NP233_g1749 [Leucocoprinus birnbaumii]